MSPGTRPAVPERDKPTAVNITIMLELERRAEADRSRVDLVSERAAQLVGNLRFVVVQLFVVSSWIAWNSFAPASWRFDAYPYGMLAIAVTLEGVLITTFVLIAQNRMSLRTERRDKLHLQIALLAEQELTIALRLLRDVAASCGASPAGEDLKAVAELSEDTNVHEIAQEIRKEGQTDGLLADTDTRR
jgi:uncharacterized membrane protein